MGQYLPIHRPGQTITFGVTSAVTGGQLVQVGAADLTVAPAVADSASVIGVAGHDAAVGDKLTVEVGKVIHELTAAGAIVRGSHVEPAGGATVRTLADSEPFGLALNSAANGQPVRVLQF